MDQTVSVINMPPVWVFYVIALAQFVFGFGILAIAAALIVMLGKITRTLADVNEMTRDISKTVPSLLSSVDATMGNVKAISDDARLTTHNLTGTVNRVSHVVGSVAGKLESPLVKSVGMLTGLAAGIGALRGSRKDGNAAAGTKKKGFFRRG